MKIDENPSESSGSGPEMSFRMPPEESHAWELEYLCVTASEDLWRALRRHVGRPMRDHVAVRISKRPPR